MTKEVVEKFKSYLDSQVGRSYSLQSYVQGFPSDKGVHCCELVSNALIKSGIDFSSNPCRETPIKIWNKDSPLYKTKEEIEL